MTDIKIVDAICGSGKTTWVFEHMRQHADRKWVFVSYHLSENKQEISVTFEEEITSNECKSNKEETTIFEDMLYQEFKALEKDYDELDNVLDKFNKRQESI